MFRKFKIFRPLCAIFCLMAAALSPCSPARGAEGIKGAAPGLSLGVMPSMDYLPLAAALREGWFSAAGLDLRLVLFYSANERDAALQSGAVDGAVTDYTSAALQKAGGLDLRLTSRCDAPFYVLLGPGLAAPAPNGMAGGAQGGMDSGGAAALKGARIAVARNTVIEYCLDMAMKQAGLRPEDSVKVEINKIPLRFEMLMNGSVAATALPNPLALLAQAGGARVIASNSSLGLSLTGLVFTAEARRNKAELIRVLYAGYNWGAAYLAGCSALDVKDILVSRMGFREEQLSAFTLPDYSRAALPPMEDLRAVIDWLAEKKLLQASMEATELVDGTFLPAE